MATVPVDARTGITVDGHVGLNDRASKARRFFIRGMVSRRIADRVSAAVGIGYFHNAEPLVPVVRERRIFADLGFRSTEQPARPLILLRTRVEQRREADHDETVWQVRQQVRVELPLSGTAEAVRLIGWHESFVALNATDWNGPSGHRSMFNFVGMSVPAGGSLRLEAGYLNVTTFIPGTNRVRYGPALIVSARL